MNMDGDLTSRNMNNGDNSNRDNPRFGNLRGKSKDNLRFSNQDNSLRRESGNRNALSLKESLEVGSIEVEKAGRIKVRGDTTIR
jgi:hypothetical protein